MVKRRPPTSAPQEERYTVKDVARIISRDQSPDGIARMMRKIRYWTTSEVLRPAGDTATGTGVSRTYTRHEVYKAAIIAELVRYGLTMEDLDTTDEWLDNVALDSGWEQAKRGEGQLSLRYAWDEDALISHPFKADFYDRLQRNKNAGASYPSSIILHLPELFGRLRF
jgi:hypothetical protein